MARYNLKTGRCSHGGMASYPNSGGAHCRSQSMPEAVYFQHMVGLPIPPPPPPQRPPSHGAFVPFKESNSTTLLKPSRRPYSSGSGLRRSQTNVGDLRKGRLSSATGRFGSSQYLAPNWTMEDMHYSSAMYAKPHELFLPARSRSNIASLYANGTAHAKDIYLKSLSPPVYQHRSMGFLSMIPEPIARNTVRQTQSCRDVNKPLHVDCSVEYDLGHQPKIPKDSAPLLIIHPEYQAMKYGSQLDSGPSSPNSYIDRAQSSPHTPIRPPPLHEGITQSVPLSKSAAMGPSRNRITRHCSFLDSTFNGMPPSSHGSQLLSNNTSLSSTSTSSSKLLRTKSKAAASCKEATALREREQRQLNQILHYQPLATQQHQQQQQHNQPHSHHPNHPDVLFEVVAAPSLAIQTPRDNVGRSRQPHRRASRSLWAMDNSDEQGFHLSLPELNPTPSYPNQASQDFTEENSHQPSTGDSTSNGSNSSQTQRLPPSKARLNLSTKLAATQKSSLGSKDSAFMMMNSEDSSSPGSNYEMNDMAGYDSGLGTPSSLTIAEGDEGSSPHHRPDQSSHRTATASSGMSSKWKSSMTGQNPNHKCFSLFTCFFKPWLIST